MPLIGEVLIYDLKDDEGKDSFSLCSEAFYGEEKCTIKIKCDSDDYIFIECSDKNLDRFIEFLGKLKDILNKDKK